MKNRSFGSQLCCAFLGITRSEIFVLYFSCSSFRSHGLSCRRLDLGTGIFRFPLVHSRVLHLAVSFAFLWFRSALRVVLQPDLGSTCRSVQFSARVFVDLRSRPRFDRIFSTDRFPACLFQSCTSVSLSRLARVGRSSRAVFPEPGAPICFAHYCSARAQWSLIFLLRAYGS
jgi:hypothetical protein